MKVHHKGHYWTSLREKFELLKKDNYAKISAIGKTWLPLLEGRQSMMQSKTKLLDKKGDTSGGKSAMMDGKSNLKANELEKEVDQKADEMIAVIENYRRKLKKQIKLFYNGREETKHETDSKVSDDISNVKEVVKEYEEIARDSNMASVIVDANNTIKSVLQWLESNYSSSNQASYFRNGRWSSQALEHMFGSIEEAPESSDHQVEQVNTKVSSIILLGNDESDINLCAVNKTEAWISENNFTSIFLVHKDGYSKREVDMKFCVQNYALSENGDLFIVDYRNKWIRKLNQDRGTIEVFSTAPMFPIDMCFTGDGNALVALSDGPFDADNANRKSYLSNMTIRGREVQRIQYHADGSTRLFSYAQALDINNTNNDIVVVDKIDDCEGVVYILDEKGNFKHSYHGSSRLDVEFNPIRTCCDDAGRILVSDVNNDVIHLLNSKAEMMQLLFLDDDVVYSPLSLSLVGQTLWIGCKNGKIVVAEYGKLEHILVLKSIESRK